MIKPEACEPVLTHARRGWMARTPDDYPYRIAVVERTDGEARVAFTKALGHWRDLHDRQEPLAAPDGTIKHS